MNYFSEFDVLLSRNFGPTAMGGSVGGVTVSTAGVEAVVEVEAAAEVEAAGTAFLASGILSLILGIT